MAPSMYVTKDFTILRHNGVETCKNSFLGRHLLNLAPNSAAKL